MKRTTGTYRKTTVAEEEVRAFLPHPLPPKRPALQVDEALTELLDSAEASIDRLAVAGEMVPSVDWLVYGFVRKEAVISSQIEGTQATLIDLLTHEAKDEPEFPEGSDLEEVCNYLAALAYARGQLGRSRGLPISMRLLNQVHRRLMAGRSGAGARPGQIRQSQNWIGGTRPGNAVFVPPPPEALADALGQLERYIHAKSPVHPLIKTSMFHAQFETINTYHDGNGRVGRLLITLLIEHWGLLTRPLLYLSLFFKQHRAEYYRRLDAVRTDGDWEGWVGYFLEGVRETSEQTTTAARQLFALVNDDRKKVLQLPSTTVAAARLFEALPEHPVVTVERVAGLLDTSKPTATKAINALMDAGVLVEATGRRRDRVFHYRAYLDLLKEGTELIRTDSG